MLLTQKLINEELRKGKKIHEIMRPGMSGKNLHKIEIDGCLIFNSLMLKIPESVSLLWLFQIVGKEIFTLAMNPDELEKTFWVVESTRSKIILISHNGVEWRLVSD